MKARHEPKKKKRGFPEYSLFYNKTHIFFVLSFSIPLILTLQKKKPPFFFGTVFVFDFVFFS